MKIDELQYEVDILGEEYIYRSELEPAIQELKERIKELEDKLYPQEVQKYPIHHENPIIMKRPMWT